MQEAGIRYEDISFREMRSDDLTDVLGIERAVQTTPWARLSFEESLTKHYLCRIAEVDSNLVGFHILSPILDEMHILNVAVSAEMQGLGLGHMLIEDIIKLARDRNLSKVFLEVRESNHKAKNLYQKWQFKQIAFRKNYYRTSDDQKENAIVMVLALNGLAL